MLIEALGWAGSVVILVAFALSSSGRIATRSALNQGMNAAGGIALAFNGLVHRAWPVVALETCWTLISLLTLGSVLIARRREGVAHRR